MVRVAKAQFTPAPFTILGWQVSDIKKVVTGLQGKGVQFERPDGNVLSVSQHG
jgi:hypothetical protein